MAKFFGGFRELFRKKKSLPKTERVLSYSPELKDFVRKNKRVLLPTYNLLQKNMDNLIHDRVKYVVDAQNGIQIFRTATGSYKGGKNLFTAKIKVNGKKNFVKIVNSEVATSIINDYKIIDKLLQEKNYKINDFCVRAIKPHLVYWDSVNKKVFVVTDFFRKGEVIQVCDEKQMEKLILQMKKKELKENIMNVLLQVLRETGRANNFFDMGKVNAFYAPKTNTIWLFDLERIA